ncbi:hypothetical protein B296_00000515 [Ensete ventricosum]|uniref:Uncharacterized protein n=1 Tax=Ensete ventricosum TaxID=4639 RepID=A0A427AUC5_ENSVE|nr:hypothetical protein B296_00000515 [Ensete ventricosum]
MTLPSPTPINVAWRGMPLPHAAAAVRPLYISVISRGTIKDHHPRDGPRDKPIDAQDEDHRGSANPRRKSRSPPMLVDLRELVRMPGLTLVVPRGMAKSYGGRAVAAVWGEGVAHHTTLIARRGAGQCHTRSPPPRMID